MTAHHRWVHDAPVWWPGPALFLGVGLAYAALSQYVIWLNDPVHNGAGFWPAAGVTLAALVLSPRRRWPWVLSAVVAAELAGDAVHGYPLVASSLWAVANAVEPLVAALILRRQVPEGSLVPVRNLMWFLVAGVVVGPFVGALIGPVGTAAEYGTPWVEVAVKWWVGDGLGVLVVAPLLLMFRQPSAPDRSWPETAGLVLLVGALTVVALRDWGPELDIVLPYVAISGLALVGLWFGVRVVIAAGFLFAQVANVANGLGWGPFHFVSGPAVHAVTVLQVFLTVALTVGLLVAVLVNDAIERARASERHRAVADALQRAVLPPSLPELVDLELAARYAPATGDAPRIGGDWYDAFTHPDGSVSLVIGDVMGHGVGAAGVMAQLRNGLRSLALELGDPARVLSALDRQLARANEQIFATAVHARFRDGELRWANAGHLPLVMARADGTVSLLDGAGNPLLGIGDSHYETRTVALRADDTMIAFTDGLIEHRDRAIEDGLSRVEDLVRRWAALGPDDLCDLLIDEALDGLVQTDDACVLVARGLPVVDLREPPGDANGGRHAGRRPAAHT